MFARPIGVRLRRKLAERLPWLLGGGRGKPLSAPTNLAAEFVKSESS